MRESLDFNKVQGICQLEPAFRHMQMVPNTVAQEDFTSGFLRSLPANEKVRLPAGF